MSEQPEETGTDEEEAQTYEYRVTFKDQTVLDIELDHTLKALLSFNQSNKVVLEHHFLNLNEIASIHPI